MLSRNGYDGVGLDNEAEVEAPRETREVGPQPTSQLRLPRHVTDNLSEQALYMKSTSIPNNIKPGGASNKTKVNGLDQAIWVQATPKATPENF